MKFSTTILCAALLFASQAEAKGTKLRCVINENDGNEEGRLAVFTRDPIIDEETGEVTREFPSHVFSGWKNLEMGLNYGVKIFDDAIPEGGSCTAAVSERFDLGNFDATSDDGKMRYRPDRELIVDGLNSTDAEGMIAALYDTEMEEIAACCVLEVFECNK